MIGFPEDSESDPIPHLILEVKEGWDLDENGELFRSESGKSITVKKGLPPSSRVLRRVPQVAGKPRGEMSKDELQLLRFYNILLPKKSDPAKYLDLVKKWPCTASVNLPAEIRAPGSDCFAPPAMPPDEQGG